MQTKWHRGWAAGAVVMMTFVCIGAGALFPQDRQSQDSARAAARVPVVVELFTSEGCSSCPPADAFLSRLEQQQPILGAEVIALEEHVDYWDELGWRDPFSSPDWTERQRSYSRTLGSGSVYTPQMIVNGSAEFVGSQERRGKEAIEEAARHATVPLTLKATSAIDKRAAEVSAELGHWERTPPAGPLEVWLAITETGLHSAVSRGENAGETLYHAAVVRKLQKLGSTAASPAGADGNVPRFAAKVTLDSKWKAENLHVVVFVQERRTLRILGAAQVRIGS